MALPYFLLRPPQPCLAIVRESPFDEAWVSLQALSPST